MFTDMVGYSALSNKDEPLAIEMLETQSRIVEPIVAMHAGRIVRTMGDGLFIEFSSGMAACRAAIEIQDSIKSHNRFAEKGRGFLIRIGIHLGDVEMKGDDLLGDGVNVAARIEPLAEPGGICITDDVARQIRNKVAVDLVDMGMQRLKNIEEPVHVHRIALNNTTVEAAKQPDATHHSIAVLPFANLSPEPDNEYFSDGLTDEILIALSKVRRLRVASRTSCFGLKGASKSMQEIGRALVVDYLLEGSVRRAGNKVRVTAQLIDVKADRPIWADRFDRDLEDIFAIQDEITDSIAKSLQIAISESERGAFGGAPTKNLEAYESFLRGVALRWAGAHRTEIVALFKRAVRLDPLFARAHAALAIACITRHSFYSAGDPSDIKIAIQSAESAMSLDPNLPEAHVALAEIAVRQERFADADRHFEDAVRVDPRCVEAHYLWGHSCKLRLQHENAIRHFAEAAQIQPDLYAPLALSVDCYLQLGRQQEAVDTARIAVERCRRRLSLQPSEHRAWYLGANNLLILGERLEAFEWADKAYNIEPNDPAVCYNLACLYAVAGEKERAVEFLDKSYKNGIRDPSWTRIDPDLASIQDDPRVQEIIRKMADPTSSPDPVPPAQ